ncbi:hypothetical protein OG455_16670 [Kitasatospora sp. NBC_01287]|uniref:hypothetical protein n=1 Tax=Kitasatospora sp. NBC_01287 TaxID=2903573 RepID=UPI00224EFF1F|nr:hypothetical protein [Kitasatospora sp. NBC_01287]MCX4747132.1 hypothetical protein [Kitasatospora sp. NBC_01287]
MVELAMSDGGGPVASPAYMAQGAKNVQEELARDLVNQVGADKVEVEVTTLQGFKSQVDQMLTQLDSSNAGSGQIAQQTLEQTHLGTGFPESSDLLAAYNVVHANLQTLSQTLSDQIEAMSIAVDINNRGYQNVDDSQRELLWNIRNQTDNQYTVGVQQGGTVAPVSATVSAPGTTTVTTATPASNTTTDTGGTGVVS